MTFEEQMELAIQQSLLETDSSYHHDNSTYNDDITSNNDDITSNNDDVMRSDQIRSNGEHMYAKTVHHGDEGYIGSYDIGPSMNGDGETDKFGTERAMNPTILGLKRRNSESDLCRYNTGTKNIDGVNAVITSLEAPASLENSVKVEHDEDEGIFTFTTDDNETDNKNDTDNTSSESEMLTKVSSGKGWSQRLKNASSALTDMEVVDEGLAEVDLVCREEMPDDKDKDEADTDSGIKRKTEIGETYELSNRAGFDRVDKGKGRVGKKDDEFQAISNGLDKSLGGQKPENDNCEGSGLTSSGRKTGCSCLRYQSYSCDFCNRNRGIKRAMFSSVKKLRFEEVVEIDSDDSIEEIKCKKVCKDGSTLVKGDKAVNGDCVEESGECSNTRKIVKSEKCEKSGVKEELKDTKGSQTEGASPASNGAVNGEGKAKFEMTEEEKSFFEEDGR